MLPSAPLTVCNDFYKELNSLTDENRFESLRRYYDSFSRNDSGFSNLSNLAVQEKIITNPSETKNILEEMSRYKNIDPRVDASKFFYFPTEAPTANMNCLEKSACMYFALKELYPSSNPALTYVMFDNGSLHATTLFTHKKRLHAADPNFRIFGEIQLTDKEIIIVGKDGEKDEVRPYEDMFRVSDNVLNQIALKLRSDKGIVDFVYDSGQITGSSGYDSMSHLFTYVDGDRIVSEIRGSTQGIRFVGGENPKTSFFGFESYWWRGITGEKELLIPEMSPFQTASLEDRVNNYYPFEGIAHFVKNAKKYQSPVQKKKIFLADKTVQERFAKSFEESKNYSEATRKIFVDFLMHKFGEDPAQIVPLRDNFFVQLMREDGKVIDYNCALSDYGFEAMYLKDVLNIIQMTTDAKRYGREIKKHMTGRESDIIV